MPRRKRKHDPQTCFRCRLHALMAELHPNGVDGDEGRYTLMAFAEASGMLLAQLSPKDMFGFGHAVAHWYHKAQESLEEEKTATRH